MPWSNAIGVHFGSTNLRESTSPRDLKTMNNPGGTRHVILKIGGCPSQVCMLRLLWSQAQSNISIKTCESTR